MSNLVQGEEIMLVWLPVSLLIFGGLGILILQRVRPGFGIAWLVSASISFLVWAIILLFGWLEIEPTVINNWAPLGSLESTLIFRFDSVSWLYAFSLVTMLLAVILTIPARLRHHSAPWAWAGSLIVTGSALLAIVAENPLTLVLAWSVIDLIEIGLILIGVIEHGSKDRAIVTYAARVAGTLVVVWTMALSQSLSLAMDFEAVSSEAGLYLLLAAGLRLGVVPLYVPYVKENPKRRGFGTIVRLASPASSLVVLGHLPDLVIPYGWAVSLSGFTALAAIYGSFMWLTADDELSGRPYWIIALAGMAVACVVRGHSSASSVWGITLLLSGTVLFLFSVRVRRILLVPMLGLIGLVGLPFTPAVSGWYGLIVYPFNFLDILFLAAHMMLVSGYIRHALREGDDFEDADQWVRIIYPIGLLLLPISQWIIRIQAWSTNGSQDYWWPGIISTVLAFCGFALLYLIRMQRTGDEARIGWVVAISRGVAGRKISGFFRLGWFYDFLWMIYKMIQRVIQALIFILEGDGGVLWSLLLLLVMISLIRIRSLP